VRVLPVVIPVLQVGISQEKKMQMVVVTFVAQVPLFVLVIILLLMNLVDIVNVILIIMEISNGSVVSMQIVIIAHLELLMVLVSVTVMDFGLVQMYVKMGMLRTKIVKYVLVMEVLMTVLTER
jgi:uncharacterized membrane protein